MRILTAVVLSMFVLALAPLAHAKPEWSHAIAACHEANGTQYRGCTTCHESAPYTEDNAAEGSKGVYKSGNWEMDPILCPLHVRVT